MADLIAKTPENNENNASAGVATKNTVAESSTGAAAGAVVGTMGTVLLGVTSLAANTFIPLVGAVVGTFLAHSIANFVERTTVGHND